MGASHRASPYNWVTIRKPICRHDTVHSVVPSPLVPLPLGFGHGSMKHHFSSQRTSPNHQGNPGCDVILITRPPYVSAKLNQVNSRTRARPFAGNSSPSLFGADLSQISEPPLICQPNQRATPIPG